MRNPLVVWKNKKEISKRQNLKDRILKNKEAVLDVMAQNIQGARACPFLLGQKCIGQLCELFKEFKTVNDITKKEFIFWKCSFTEIPDLLIELITQIRNK